MNFKLSSRRSVSAALFAFFAIPAILAIGRPVRGQEPPSRRLGQQEQDDSARIKKSGTVVLEVAVSDKEGHALNSLTKNDFTVYEDGSKQTITKFSATEAPFTVLLLLDLSGSTSSEIELMKSAAKGFLGQVRGEDLVGVATFSNGGEIAADFDDERGEIKRKIDHIAPPAGYEDAHNTVDTGTSFYDALNFAVDASPLSQVEGRKAVVCITDGVDSTSTLRYADIAGDLERSGTSLYFVQLNTEKQNLSQILKDPSDPDYANFSRSQLERYFDRFEPDPYAPDRQLSRRELPPDLRTKINAGLYEIARQQLSEMAQHTGGRVYPVNGAADLSGIFKQVASDLRSRYSIEYQSTNQARDGKWRTVRIDVAAPGAVVHSRPGYRAPAK